MPLGRLLARRPASSLPAIVWQSSASYVWSSEGPRPHRVMVIDDDVNLQRLLRAILRSAGIEVIVADDGLTALDLVEQEKPQVIILDLRMPRLDGRGFFREIRSRGIMAPVLIASAFGARTAQLELGAQGSIEKPFDPERLIEAVNALLPGE